MEADKIKAGAVDATKISVGNLAAINAKLGSVSVGGGSNTNGKITIYNTSGDEIGKWDSGGILIQDTTRTGRTYMAANALFVDAAGNGGAVVVDSTDQSYQAVWGAYKSRARISSTQQVEAYTYDMVSAHQISDKRIKTKIKDIDRDFSKALILSIKPKQFRYKNSPETLQYGVIAQDVLKILNDCGITDETRICYGSEEEMYGVEYRQFIAPMISVIQSQQEEIDLLKKELAELKARIN